MREDTHFLLHRPNICPRSPIPPGRAPCHFTWVYIDNLQPESLAHRLLVKHYQQLSQVHYLTHLQKKGRVYRAVPAYKGSLAEA
eukprot:1083318-Pelagomonas_calceolata.AAC.1